VAPEQRSFERIYITERQLEILSWVQKGKSASRDVLQLIGNRSVDSDGLAPSDPIEIGVCPKTV
jgi:hypothetical protein